MNTYWIEVLAPDTLQAFTVEITAKSSEKALDLAKKLGYIVSNKTPIIVE